MSHKFDVSSICNVLVDILIHISDEDLKALDLEKGKMHLVDKFQQRRILDYFQGHSRKVELGGSSLNTIKALAQLECQVSFSGMVGQDSYGKVAREGMDAFGIKSFLQQHDSEETGKSLVLVSPDGERTMNTYLGASSLYQDQSLSYDLIRNSRFFHFSGYQWDTEDQKNIAMKSIKIAKENSCLVSFDLADPFVVKKYKQDFLSLLDHEVDIFFGNREEIALLFDGLSMESLFREKKREVIAVIKLDKDGAVVYNKGKKFIIPPVVTNVVDTTGAGDMFAAGFLCGMINGLKLDTCGKIASILASDVISHFGAVLSADSLNTAIAMIFETRKELKKSGLHY